MRLCPICDRAEVEEVDEEDLDHLPDLLGVEPEATDDTAQDQADEEDAEEESIDDFDSMTDGELRLVCKEACQRLIKEGIVVSEPVVWNGECGAEEVKAAEMAGFLYTMYKVVARHCSRVRLRASWHHAACSVLCAHFQMSQYVSWLDWASALTHPTEQVEYWWWECFEMVRKLIINGVLVHVANNDIRLAIGFSTCFLSLLLSFAARPFASPKLNHLLLSGLSIQTLTLAYGLLLIVKDNVRGDTATSASEMKALEWVVTLVSLSPLHSARFAFPTHAGVKY